MRYTISITLASLLALPALAPLPALAEVPKVVTDIPPVQALVAQVMGDLGQPELLLAKGADEHDFALRPSQMGAIADAGLVVWVGPELTPWLSRALEGSSAPQLALLEAEGTHRQDYAPGAEDEEDHDHDHAAEEAGHDDHDHDAAAEPAAATEDHDHEHEGHTHTGTDPHAWLDPGNAEVWLGLIAAELSRLDPENAATYAANADAARARVIALDAEVTSLLAPVKDRPFVTFHAAYGYFAAHYGLTYVGALALGDASAPGAAHIAELRDEITHKQVACLFPEVQHDPALLTTLAEGTGAKIGGTLDPVGSSLEAGPDAYDTLLRGMATTLADCLTP